MTNLQIIKKLQKIVKKNPSEFQAVSDLFEMLRIYESENYDKSHGFNKDLRVITAQQAKNGKLGIGKNTDFYYLHKKTLLFDAKDEFDAFLQYVEFDRDPDKKFYIPRRKIIKPIVDSLQEIEDDKIDLLAISQPPGTGKQLSDDTPILTREGWKNHGDLQVGDEVIGIDGKFKKVTFIFPKTLQNCRVHFSNGDYIDCHENHEWVVYDRGFPKKPNRIMETKAIEKRKLESGGNERVRGHRYIIQIPNKEPIRGDDFKKLYVPPYTLGAWLGDGTNTKPCITCSKDDLAIIESIVRDGYLISSSHTHKITGCHSTYFQKLRADLKKYGLCYRDKTVEKYIPDDYLTAPLSQRLDLLAGLIDTDGALSEKGKYRFTTSEQSLRDSFVDLLSTFGWRACVIEEKPRTSSSGIVGKKSHWVIQFTPSLEIPCRLPRKQYSPNRKPNRIAITKIERIEPKWGNCIEVEGGVYLAGKSMIPTHNSTLGIFFLSWIMGKYPNMPNLASAHADKLTRSFYDGVLTIITDPEYLWADVFPGVQVQSTNSKDETINLDKPKRFKSLTCRSIDGSLTGATRCEKILYADDLVSGIEEALSIDRLDSLWNKYTNDLKSRKKQGCKEIHIATRWSVHDPIGRLQKQYENDPRAKFIAFPALDENDESNFNYKYGVGFDTKYFHDMRDNLDDVSWKCLYMNEPIEREGLLYSEEDLRRYYELPEGEPDAIIAVCDTAEGGGDDTFLPVAYVYGNDYYIEDCVCDNSLPEITDALCAEILLKHRVKQCQFESNSAGGRTADKVQEKVKEKSGITHITKKRTTSNKETKIIVNSTFVKERFVFKDKSQYRSNSSYAKMMRLLCSYTMMGKNKHDDVPDGLAQLAEYIQSLKGREVEVIKRPF